MKHDNSVRKFSFVTLGGMISSGIQAGFYIIFASLLEPESYGEFSYLVALAGAFAIVSRFGLSSTVIVYQSEKKFILSDQANILATITAGIASLILIPINIFSALLCLSLSFFIMNQHNLLGLKQYKNYFLIVVIRSVIILFLPIILYFVFDISGALIGLAIGNLVVSFQFLKKLNVRIKGFQQLRSDFKVILHNFGVETSTTLPRIIDKLLIVPLVGFAITGIYQLNIQILFALTILPIGLRVFLLSEESAGIKHTKIIYSMIFVSLVLAILVSVVSPYFINQFFPKYTDGIEGLQILVFSIIPLTITSILYARLQAKKSTKVGFAALVSIGTLLGFIFILAELYGIIGLSIAVLLSACLETIFLFILVKLQDKKITNTDSKA